MPGMHPALQAMLVDTVSIAPYVGQDAYGKPTYGAAVLHPARLEYELTTVRTPQGQERTSTSVVVLNGDFVLTERDKLTLADGTSPAIQQVARAMKPFSAALDHYEVRL
jgi:hypothetical protein